MEINFISTIKVINEFLNKSNIYLDIKYLLDKDFIIDILLNELSIKEDLNLRDILFLYNSNSFLV